MLDIILHERGWGADEAYDCGWVDHEVENRQYLKGFRWGKPHPTRLKKTALALVARPEECMQYISIDNYPSCMLNDEDWGGCQLFLEIGSDGYAVRQMEFHHNGKKLKYAKNAIFQDEFSALVDNHFCANDSYEFGEYRYTTIDQSTFDIMWDETPFDNIGSWRCEY